MRTAPPEEHIHRFRFPPADGRRILPGRCDCGAKRSGYASWEDDDVRAAKSRHTPDAPPKEAVALMDRQG